VLKHFADILHNLNPLLDLVDLPRYFSDPTRCALQALHSA